MAVGILCHLLPREHPQHADVHQQVKRSDDTDRTKHSARNRPLRIADFRNQKTHNVVSPIIVCRYKYTPSMPDKKSPVQVKRACWKIERAMSIEMRKSRDNNEHQRKPHGQSQPPHDAIDYKDASV